MDDFINAQRLHRANSFIRVRKETAGKLLEQKRIARLYVYGTIENRVSAFLTNPNAFKQCTITLLTTDEAITNIYMRNPLTPELTMGGIYSYGSSCFEEGI